MPFNLLLLEDNSDDVVLIRHQLRGQAVVEVAVNREPFEAALRAKRYDAILVDYAIPQLPGQKAIQVARSIAPMTPIIIVSGSVTEEQAIEAVRVGAVDFCNKSRLGWLPGIVKRVVMEAKASARAIQMQRIENIGTLTAGITHDLNNLIFHLVCAHELVARTSSPENKRILARATETANRAIDLVRHLTMFSRGTDSPAKVLVNMPTLVQTVANVARETFPRSIRIDVQASGPVPDINANETQVHQVLLNLLINAKDALGDEPGLIKLAVDRVSLADFRMSTHPLPVSGEFVRVSVQDSNGGIPDDVLPHIFEGFYTTKPDGSGIGLSTVRSILLGHGGYIDVSTIPRGGSTFTVLFPVAGPEPPAELKTEYADGEGQLILIVDDELVILDVIRQILESFNYTVLIAGTGSEALAIYRERHTEIAVVITDFQMQNISGIALCGFLREINPNVKIMGMTGLASDPTLKTECKLDCVLMKPFASRVLLDALRVVCKNSSTS